jgi:hypothetical protein
MTTFKVLADLKSKKLIQLKVETNQNGYIMETADMRRGVKQQLTQI